MLTGHMTHSVVARAAALMVCGAVGSVACFAFGETFTNPIAGGDGADPFVMYDAASGCYYGLRTDCDRVELHRSHHAADIFSSDDSKVVFRPNVTNGIYGMIWAPEMHKAEDGRWYIYSSGEVRHNGKRFSIFVLQSKTADPFDGFEFAGIPDPSLHSFDPTVWIAPDGHRYLVYCFGAKGGLRLGIRPLANPWTYAGPNVELTRAELPWEISWEKQHITEGPFGLKRGKRSYIVYSANGCWNDDYALGVLEFMGGNPLAAANWKKHPKPILVKGNGVFGPGHASFFRSPDGKETWCAYHGLTEHNENHKPASRKANLQKVEWTDDDYPVLGIPTPRGMEVVVPSGEPETFVRSADLHCRDPFVLAADGQYLLYQTATYDGRCGMSVRASRDLENWTEPREVLRVPADVPATMLWAPEIHKYKGEYYAFVTLTEKPESRYVSEMIAGHNKYLRPRGVWIFKAKSPLGPFKPLRNAPVTPLEWMTLDGTLWIEDGKPYMVFCHEWCQVKDGRMCYVPLSCDLSCLTAEPTTMFSARVMDGANNVTDGPFLYKSPKSGALFMIWSNHIGKRGYCVLLRKSESGKLSGPWTKDEILFGKDGGHGMIFNAFDGRLMMAIHAPNKSPNERLRLIELEDTGDSIRIKNNIL